MHFRFLVALVAFTRGAAIYIIDVTVRALHIGVFTVQDEEIIVVVVAEPVDAVMACHTFRPVLLLVVSHELGIMLAVAVYTSLDLHHLQVLRVAGSAGDRLV